jgi:hypothetical protein
MDLSKLDVVELANKGTVLELKFPFDVAIDGKEYFAGDVMTDEKGKEPKPFYLRLLGSDSDVYRNGIKRKLEIQLNKNKDGKNKKVDLDHEQLKGAELMAKCTTECYFIENGKPVECTTSEMTRVYLKYPWMREQAEAQMADRSALMKG